MKTYEVKVRKTYTSQDMSDWLITAIEGGISYWCSAVWIKDKAQSNMSYQLEGLFEHPEAWSIYVEDAEDETTVSARGLAFIDAINKVPEHVRNRLLADDHEYDAEDADAWFQCAIFGEVVYG